MKPDVSVVLVTSNRCHLLERSMACWAHQTVKDFELIIVDDDSSDRTAEVVYQWQRSLSIKYVRVRKPENVGWRDCAVNFNLGIRAAAATMIVGTHPEVMPGPDVIKWFSQPCPQSATPHVYHAIRPYYLTPDEQLILDAVGSREYEADAPAFVRTLPGFYDRGTTDVSGHDYSPKSVEAHPQWESFVLGGMSRDTWKYFGGFTEFECWGSIDVDFLNRRRVLGIKTVTCNWGTAFCVHQNHDSLGTPRDMELCMKSLPCYPSTESARKSFLWT